MKKYVKAENIPFKIPESMMFDPNARELDLNAINDRAQKDYKLEQERLAEEARKAELAKQAEPLLAEIRKEMDSGSDASEAFFAVLVPGSGKADTVAGEIARAVNRVAHRWFNDGDFCFMGYGLETCSRDMEYLLDMMPELYVPLEAVIDAISTYGVEKEDEDRYEGFIDQLVATVNKYLLDNPHLISEPNDVDSRYYNSSDYDLTAVEPKFEWDVSLPSILTDMIYDGDYSERDLLQELESWDMFRNCDMEIYMDSIYFSDLDYDTLNELERSDVYGCLERFADELAEELGYNEYDG